MELKKIRYFLRIVETGSLSKAADSLYLTQPTLSRFLAKLEEEAGTKLFHREKNNALTLTESGRIYWETAKKMDVLWTGLETELERLQQDQGEKILLGLDADSLLPFASACADALSAQHPHVSVQILRGNAFEIQKNTAEGIWDIGLTAYAEEDSRLTYVPIRSGEVDLIVNPGNPLASRSCGIPGQENCRVQLDMLDRQTPFALIQNTTVLRQLEDQYLKSRSFTPNVVRTYNQHRSVVDMVAGNPELAGFCPANYRSDRVAYLALDPPFFYTKGLCYRKNTRITPALRTLMALLHRLPHTTDLDK